MYDNSIVVRFQGESTSLLQTLSEVLMIKTTPDMLVITVKLGPSHQSANKKHTLDKLILPF